MLDYTSLVHDSVQQMDVNYVNTPKWMFVGFLTETYKTHNCVQQRDATYLCTVKRCIILSCAVKGCTLIPVRGTYYCAVKRCNFRLYVPRR